MRHGINEYHIIGLCRTFKLLAAHFVKLVFKSNPLFERGFLRFDHGKRQLSLRMGRIIHAHYGAARNERMASEHAFDMRREYLMSVKKRYHALYSSLYVDKAVGVHVADIAAVYPQLSVGMTAYDVFRFSLVIEVAEHDRRAAYADLAFFAVVKLIIRAGLKYADSRCQQRIADRQALEVSVAAAGCSPEKEDSGSLGFQESCLALPRDRHSSCRRRFRRCGKSLGQIRRPFPCCS